MAGKSAKKTARKWVSEPELADERIRAATGKGWDEWCDVIDAWPGHADGHTAIAAWLVEEHGVDGWWAQGVTVGYERIKGLRLPHQRPDGTFEASLSRTIRADAAALRERLLDEGARANLFPGHVAELRSRPTSKNVRLGVGPGTAEFAIAPASEGRAKVTIAHTKLPTFEAVAEWKAFWAEWLAGIDGR